MQQKCQVSNLPLLIVKYNSPTATKQHKSGLQQKINSPSYSHSSVYTTEFEYYFVLILIG